MATRMHAIWPVVLVEAMAARTASAPRRPAGGLLQQIVRLILAIDQGAQEQPLRRQHGQDRLHLVRLGQQIEAPPAVQDVSAAGDGGLGVGGRRASPGGEVDGLDPLDLQQDVEHGSDAGRVAAALQKMGISGCRLAAPPIGEDQPAMVRRALLIMPALSPCRDKIAKVQQTFCPLLAQPAPKTTGTARIIGNR